MIPLGQGFHHLQHFADHLRVQRRPGFIEQNDLRRGGEGAGDRHPLLLPARELGRHLPGFIRQANLAEQRQRALAGGAFAPAVNAFQREGNILLRRQVGVEIKLLKNEADPAAQLAQGAAGKLARRFAVDQNLAAAKGFQLIDQADQG